MNAIDISWTIHCPAICPKRVVVLLKKCLFTFHVYSMSHIKWEYSSNLFVMVCDAQCTSDPIGNIWIFIAIQNRIYSIFDFLCFLFALSYSFHKVKFIMYIYVQANSRYINICENRNELLIDKLVWMANICRKLYGNRI